VKSALLTRKSLKSILQGVPPVLLVASEPVASDAAW
jgi:hypothetical protein